MEIARLEISMQRHIDRMQDTIKINYVQYGKSSKSKMSKPGKFKQCTVNGSSGGSSGTFLNMVERVRKFHYLQTFAGDVVKADTRKDNLVKHWKQCAGTVPSKDTLRKSALKGVNVPHI